MKTRKIVATILSASMLMGVFAGCSKVKKVSLKDTDKAADKVEANVYELDADDVIEGDVDIDEDDLEDGIYISVSNETIQDLLDELPKEASKEIDRELDPVFDVLDIKYDYEDLQEASIYVRMADEENMCAVIYVDLGDEEVCGDLFNSIIDYSEDMNDMIEDSIEELDLDDSEYFEDYEFNLDNLGKKEYYFNGSDKGYLKMCITPDVIEEMMDEDIPEILDELDVDFDEDDIEDALDEVLDEMPFEVAGFGIYFNGSSVVVTFIVAEDEDFIADYETYMKGIGLESPTKAPISKDTREVLMPILLMNVSTYMERAKEAAYRVDAHNEAISSVVDEIEAYS